MLEVVFDSGPNRLEMATSTFTCQPNKIVNLNKCTRLGHQGRSITLIQKENMLLEVVIIWTRTPLRHSVQPGRTDIQYEIRVNSISPYKIKLAELWKKKKGQNGLGWLLLAYIRPFSFCQYSNTVYLQMRTRMGATRRNSRWIIYQYIMHDHRFEINSLNIYK